MSCSDSLSICLDASAFRPYKGNSVYTLNLIRELSKQDKIARIIVRVSDENREYYSSLGGECGVDLVTVRCGRLDRLVDRLPRDGYDLFHQPGGQEPILKLRQGACPSVFTFHDANYLRGHGGFIWKAYKILSTAAMLNRASGLIFISEFSRSEFCKIRSFQRFLTKLPHRIIWNGCSFPSAEPAPLPRSGPWICFANQAHKRSDIVISAFNEWRKGRGGSEKLVVIGTPPQGFENQAFVEFQSKLSAGDLVKLVGQAKGLLFPSEYEGFGLPVLEAAISGTPVIANELPAIREVFGDTVAYASKNAVSEYVLWMNMFDDAPNVVTSQARRAWVRAKGITWQRNAEKVADFYCEVLRAAQ